MFVELPQITKNKKITLFVVSEEGNHRTDGQRAVVVRANQRLDAAQRESVRLRRNHLQLYPLRPFLWRGTLQELSAQVHRTTPLKMNARPRKRLNFSTSKQQFYNRIT